MKVIDATYHYHISSHRPLTIVIVNNVDKIEGLSHKNNITTRVIKFC